jgi:Flp pilus assembly protein TadG
MSRPRPRPKRKGMDAQAVIETALVIPVLLALISAFLAVMVQVCVQQEMDAATKLAAESFFQAPQLATDSGGTTCCPQATAGADSLDTSGMPKGCRFAAETFYAPKARGPSRLLRDGDSVKRRFLVR